MHRYRVTYTRRVRENHEVVVEADSESAVRQMWIVGDYPSDPSPEVDVLSEDEPDIDEVSDNTPLTEDPS